MAGYYVGRGVVRRLVGLQNSMKSIAAGDLTTEIATGGSDEIADMAGALQVFKDNMLESNRLRAERAEAEKHAHAQRRAEMRKLADEFEAAVGEIVQTVSSASTELEASATSLTRTAEETQQLSGKVEAASEEASSNVRSVAAATEEMSGVDRRNQPAGPGIQPDRRRSRQSGRGYRCAHQRTVEGGVADRRRGQSDHLDRGADQSAGAERHHRGGARRRIRTRLCGGRAGSQGAGRADRQRDQGNQQPDRRHAGCDPGIGAGDQADRHHHRPDFAKSRQRSPTSVDQQGGATQEIARNVEQAAQGTTEVATNIVDVNNGARETGAASAQVLSAAQSLSGESNRLKLEVGKFLDTVRAA